jgi:hypothetical protein
MEAGSVTLFAPSLSWNTGSSDRCTDSQLVFFFIVSSHLPHIGAIVNSQVNAWPEETFPKLFP